MQRFHYFAYGSNMLVERLTARCASARVVTTAVLDDHRLCLNKRSIDGSAKATIMPMEGYVVHGVVFELDNADQNRLDSIEGPGYRRLDAINVRPHDPVAGPLRASTYIANAFEDGLQPFDWYVELILAGGIQHGLPAHYVSALRAIPAIPDPDADRRTAREALAILRGLEPAKAK